MGLAENSFSFAEEDSFEVHLQGLRITRLPEGFFFTNPAFLHQFVERLIEVLHSVVLTGFDGSSKRIQAIVFDQFPDGTAVDHDFLGGCHAAVHGGDHSLTDDCPEGLRQLLSNLLSFVRLEEIEDAVHRLTGVGGMKRGKHEVTRFSGADRGSETCGVTHFPNHDDIGVLAQDVFEVGLDTSS